MEEFRSLFEADMTTNIEDNFRPVLPLNGRTVSKTFSFILLWNISIFHIHIPQFNYLCDYPFPLTFDITCKLKIIKKFYLVLTLMITNKKCFLFFRYMSGIINHQAQDLLQKNSHNLLIYCCYLNKYAVNYDFFYSLFEKHGWLWSWWLPAVIYN